jgi:hypothetical protein
VDETLETRRTVLIHSRLVYGQSVSEWKINLAVGLRAATALDSASATSSVHR